MALIRVKVQSQEISTTSETYKNIFSDMIVVNDNKVIQNHLHFSARDVLKENKTNNLRIEINKNREKNISSWLYEKKIVWAIVSKSRSQEDNFAYTITSVPQELTSSVTSVWCLYG